MKFSNKYGLTSPAIKSLVSILFLFTVSFEISVSQTPDEGIIKSSEKLYNEELIIRTDRDMYISGEKVWLKIYKLNGLNHTPENVSKIVYVELIDTENNPVNQLKVGIDGYSGSAVFRLPDTLSTGNYFIRSYTSWMQNFSEDLFSYRKISVINPFKIDNIRIPARSPDADTIIFSPEGGSLIKGMESRLGFRSMDSDGDPVAVSGAVTSSENDTLTQVQSDSEGYGWTRIKPSGHGNLYLVTRDGNGRVKKFRLPTVKNDGVSITVPAKNDEASILAIIWMSNNYPPAGNSIFLELNTPGIKDIKRKISTGKDGEIILLKKYMPSGLLHMVITDTDGTTLAERWLCNETGQTVNFNIDIPKISSFPREKIKLGITATDSRGKPVESDLSVSVVKAVTISDKNSDRNIYRQLPGLIACNPDKPPDINDLLIFYNPNDPVSDQPGKFQNGDPLFLPELDGHLISGNIKNRKTGEPVRKENVSLSFVGKAALCQFAKTNEKGEFHFKTSEQGMREIVIQPLSEKITDYYVELITPFTSASKQYSCAPFIPDSSRLPEINNVIISSQINNIYEPYTEEARIIPVVRKRPDFYGKPDNTILLSKYIELTSLKEVVKEIIPGVATVKKNDRVNFKLFYQYQSQPYENNPLVLVDGVPVYDLEKVIAINSKDLEKIDVFTTRYYISDIVMDGILHFVTKNGNLDVIDLNRSVYRVQYDLPEIRNEFWSPGYPTEELMNGHLPDFRNTLYWNPEIHTGKNGKAEVEFYSSDESTEYIISVEGITGDGIRGFTTMPLIIKNR
jgi:hypothetical protein